MNELTIKEIAEKLGIGQVACKARLYRLGIKPIRLVGNTGIYDQTVINSIKDVNPVGRPSQKKADAPVKKVAKKAAPVKTAKKPAVKKRSLHCFIAAR